MKNKGKILLTQFSGNEITEKPVDTENLLAVKFVLDDSKGSVISVMINKDSLEIMTIDGILVIIPSAGNHIFLKGRGF